MKKYILALIVLSLVFAFPVHADEYNVSTPHVIINQVYGSGPLKKSDGYFSRSFIELYNPTSYDVDLTGWAIHYRSSSEDTVSGDKWYKTALSGDIPSKHSYLIVGEEDPAYCAGQGSPRSSQKAIEGTAGGNV